MNSSSESELYHDNKFGITRRIDSFLNNDGVRVHALFLLERGKQTDWNDNWQHSGTYATKDEARDITPEQIALNNKLVD